jgi:capsular exopolysaccharide synthesis family protein
MSKIFEALKRIERESGSLSSDFAAEAQVVFEATAIQEPVHADNGSYSAEDAPRRDESAAVSNYAAEGHTTATTEATSADHAEAGYFPTILSLDHVPQETAFLGPESRLVFYSDPHGAGADRFRLLKMRLQRAWDTGRLRRLLITSPGAGEGKSTVALNLAMALADQGRRSVLLMECDLRRPIQTTRLGLKPGPGLAECIASAANPISALRRVEPLGFYLLPAGKVQGNPTELLQSELFAGVMQTLSQCFDWIVIDSPPATPLADVPALKAHADASLLVVKAGSTAEESIEAAIAHLGTKHVLGMVLNGAEHLDQLYSRYY